MSKLVTVKITFLNLSTCYKEVVIGKIERWKLEYFYNDNQGWIFIESEPPAVIYKFDIDEVYDCSHDKLFVIDKEKLKEHLEPVYITGFYGKPSLSYGV